jgi:hypothetical protein
MLEICEREVEHLVNDLFGIDVMSVMGNRHLILGKGVKLTSNTSNPELTLKGVRDEAIIHILGPRCMRQSRQVGCAEENWRGKRIAEQNVCQ